MKANHPKDTPFVVIIKRGGLLIGAVAFAVTGITSAPSGLSDTAWLVAGLALLMAIWWMTETVPLAVTALVPLIVLPPLGVNSFEAVAQSYAHPLIFLFFGGFLIAQAMKRWNLHRYIALALTRTGGNGPRALVGGLMAATAFLSMWISNTAAAMVMLPIGQSIIAQSRDHDIEDVAGFQPALMLGIAYAATIGGMATLIGTPPNALFAAYLEGTQGHSIRFSQWMMIGLPIALTLLPITWLLLTRVVFAIPIHGQEKQADMQTPALPALSFPARTVALVIGLAGLCLVMRPMIESFVPALAITDAGIFLTAAFILFIIPARDPANSEKQTTLLRWQDAAEIRWDVLILFGGGLALASVISESGLSHWIGSALESFDALPISAVILIAMALVVLIGELASNTAMAAVFLPIAGATAIGLGSAPLEFVLPIALAASLGFMLPVATPPNAIVYGSGEVTNHQMLKAGAILDVVSIFIVFGIASALGSTFSSFNATH